VYHALNRPPFFQKEREYQAFERVMAEALAMHPIRVLACCLPTNDVVVGIARDATPARSPAQKRGQWGERIVLTAKPSKNELRPL
jgi:hypothetical protein